MLLTENQAEERIWHYVRDVGSLNATAFDVARVTDSDPADAQHVLDDLVARNLLRRFDTPGTPVVYWS